MSFYTDDGDEVEINLGPFGYEVHIYFTNGYPDGSGKVKLSEKNLAKIKNLIVEDEE